MIFPTYELDCKSTTLSFGPHQIDLPLPAQVTLGGAPPSRDHIKNIAFACPLCHHVHKYDGADLKHRVNHASLDQMPPVPIPVRVDTRCDQPGCGAAVTIYTTRSPSENKQDVLLRLRRAIVHVQCANGHVPGFACDQQCEIVDGPLCNPF